MDVVWINHSVVDIHPPPGDVMFGMTQRWPDTNRHLGISSCLFTFSYNLRLYSVARGCRGHFRLYQATPSVHQLATPLAVHFLRLNPDSASLRPTMTLARVDFTCLSNNNIPAPLFSVVWRHYPQLLCLSRLVCERQIPTVLTHSILDSTFLVDIPRMNIIGSLPYFCVHLHRPSTLF